MRRSPKKTAVLALLGVVALWFWAPLVWKWISPQESAPAVSATPAAEAVAPDSAAGAVATQPAASVATWNWKELADVLQSDPLLASARLHERIADPFAKPKLEGSEDSVAELEQEQPLEQFTQARPTPDQLGLTLAGTITGGRRAVATINGKPCRVGDVIVVSEGGIEFEFAIIEIAAGEVTLVAGEETHMVSVRRPASTMQLSQVGTASWSTTPDGGQRIMIGARLGE